MTTDEKVKKIKQSFRLYMNGVTAQSQRDKGTQYKLNWGVSLQHLQEMSAEWGKDYDLAIALWKNDVRECKLLATLIMPAERMEHDLVDVWMEDCHTQELGEQLVQNLLQYCQCAPNLAFEWIATDNELLELCGFNLMSRLLSKGMYPNERASEEVKDQAEAVVNDQTLPLPLRHAANNCLGRLEEL